MSQRQELEELLGCEQKQQMRRPKSNRKTSAAKVVHAGAAGGGIGTVIAAIASRMPNGGRYQSLLVISAPLLAVGISSLWLFLKTAYIDPYTAARRHATADTAMKTILAAARKNADEVWTNPNSSEMHKKEVQRMVEGLENLQLRKIAERMQIISADQ